MLIFKILTAAQWAEFRRDGVFRGAPVDLADGFIHFSTAEQMRETAAKHFAGHKDLHLVWGDADPLGDALKWEVSRGGALFPHLYRELTTQDIVAVHKIGLENGTHVFPGDMI